MVYEAEMNPYLYDSKGPKNRVDYSQITGEVQHEDEPMDGSYSIVHQNEKFVVNPQNDWRLIEQEKERDEREIQEALEKIRDMEEREKQNKNGNLLDFLKQGDSVYELYSVLVHSGAAIGGHYYAYIKSFEDDQWYKFDDYNVSKVTQDEVSGVYGDKKGGCPTAYMLMYRQYDPTLKENPIEIPDTLIPEYLTSEIDEETN